MSEERTPSAFEDPHEAIAGVIYGSIIYLAVLAVLSEEHPPPTDGETAIVLCGTALVYWLAHVYAQVVPRIAAGRTGDLGRAAGRELPVLASVLVPMVPVVLHALGFFARETVYQVAIAGTLATLFVAVLLIGRRSGRTWTGALAASLAALVAGVFIYTLKAALH